MSPRKGPGPMRQAGNSPPRASARRTRPCSVCQSRRYRHLHTQAFLLPRDRLTSYDVVQCRSCGFAFAQNIPSPEEYEAYYRANLKYTYEGAQHTSPAHDRIHSRTFSMVDRFLKLHPRRFPRETTSILDVGCSTGRLLACFRDAGYGALLGLDPSPRCRALARQMYGVEVATGSLLTFRPGRRFDVILLSSVLEHLPDPAGSLRRVRSLLRENGLLFIQVPEVERFGIQMKEPFLEFSIEHINYFTHRSLANLLGIFGFRPLRVQSDVLRMNTTAYPAINSLWRSTHRPRKSVRAPEDGARLRRYIARSSAELQSLDAAIRDMLSPEEEIVVWGVGSLTARLLATTSLRHRKIRAFVDSNPGLQGQKLLGLPILPPASLTGQTTTVLVSSIVWGAEIRRTLEEQLRYQGRILTLPGRDRRQGAHRS